MYLHAVKPPRVPRRYACMFQKVTLSMWKGIIFPATGSAESHGSAYRPRGAAGREVLQQPCRQLTR